MGVKPPRKEGVRVFIQSTSQGARCVKPGDTILYKVRTYLLHVILSLYTCIVINII